MKYYIPPIPKTVVREVVVPSPRFEIWHGRPGSDRLVQQAPGFFDGIDLGVAPPTVDDIAREISRLAREPDPPRVLLVHPTWYRRLQNHLAFSDGWAAWGEALASRGWSRRHFCGACWLPGARHPAEPYSAPPVVWRPMAMGRAFERARKARS